MDDHAGAVQRGRDMIIVEKKAVPIYELKCFECGSRIHYKKVEVSEGSIKCPVCGIRNEVIPKFPANYLLGEGIVELETPQELYTTQSNDSNALDALGKGEE